MRLRAVLLAAGLSALSASAAAYPVTDLQRAGPATQRFNVAILGDGYRAEDQTKLTSDAQALVDALFDSGPYEFYRQLFNIKVVQTVSVDRGAKDGSAASTPNTLFGAYFECEGVSQLLCMNDAEVLAAAAVDVPEFNLALVIVNDDKYGGAGGTVPCVSTHEGAAEILRHELAHRLANLADEYQDPYPSYPPCSTSDDCTEPNVTVRSVRSQIKWLDWLADSTPVPTNAGQGFAGVGLFEGARYLTTGLYRPVDTACKMHSLDSAFCPVCSEALVRSFWDLENVHLIDRAVPASERRETTCIDATFSIETPAITPNPLLSSWTIDGEPTPSAGSTLTIAPGTLTPGPHQIAVQVRDTTALVRNDPNDALSESHSFVFHAPDCEKMPNAGGSAAANAAGAPGTGGAAEHADPSGGAGNASGGSGDRAGSPSAGSQIAAGRPNIAPPPQDDHVGCACRSEGSSVPGSPISLLGLVGLGALRRRRAPRVEPQLARGRTAR